MDIKTIGKAIFVLLIPIVYLGSFTLCSFATVIFCNWFDEKVEQKRNKKDV